MLDVLTRDSLREVISFVRRRPVRLLSAQHWARALLEQRRRGIPSLPAKLADMEAFKAWRNAEVPSVSIIIPVYNQIQTTLECLRAVIGAGSDPALELVVVDDASTDTAVQCLQAHGGISYRRNPVNAGFVASCNLGAEIARGRILVFLNSDTLVTPRWLEPLLARLEEPGVGLAGACLQYPDGRLQEAGGVVFTDGSGWNYGRGGHPDDPRYLSRRDVHYCSGAALALCRERFHDLGGFDPLFAPGYYEDTDLAMRIRASGARVVYEPRSVVVHMEGMSAGTDLTQGMKSAQVVNRGKFHQRWQDTLEARHPAAGTDVDLAMRQTGAGWIVASATGLPSGKFLATLASLADRGCAVDFFPGADLPAEQVLQMRSRGVTVWSQAWRATGLWLLARIGAGAKAVLTDGSALSGEWVRKVDHDLPGVRRLLLAPNPGSPGPFPPEWTPVSDAEEILVLLDA